MKKIRMQKGITLIALIITIIILLILAVVTIGSIKNRNIITYAQNASKDYNDKKVEEESIIAGYESLIESKLPGEKGGSKVTYTDEGVPVPAGFKVVTGTKVDGLVIENETEGSQFVWVPVEEDITTSEAEVIIYDEDVNNLKIINDKLGTTYSNSNDFLLALQTDFEKMKVSVNYYNGFYVGRYEVSYNSKGEAKSKGSSVEPYVYSAINSTTSPNNNNATNWYGLYALCKTYNTDSVKSSMIWGCQYDAMYTWMEEEEIKFDRYKYNNDSDRRTGYVPKDVLKNVYDLAGNSYEWMIKADGSYGRKAYGGAFNSGIGGSLSFGATATPVNRNGDFSSRLTLYIEL